MRRWLPRRTSSWPSAYYPGWFVDNKILIGVVAHRRRGRRRSAAVLLPQHVRRGAAPDGCPQRVYPLRVPAAGARPDRADAAVPDGADDQLLASPTPTAPPTSGFDNYVDDLRRPRVPEVARQQRAVAAHRPGRRRWCSASSSRCSPTSCRRRGEKICQEPRSSCRWRSRSSAPRRSGASSTPTTTRSGRRPGCSTRSGRRSAATPQTWLQIETARLNSILLMVILIWLQVGFAMILLCSAHQGRPRGHHRGGPHRRRERAGRSSSGSIDPADQGHDHHGLHHRLDPRAQGLRHRLRARPTAPNRTNVIANLFFNELFARARPDGPRRSSWSC